MSRSSWLTIIGVCAAGLLVGLGVRPLLFPTLRIALYPEVIEAKDGCIQGKPLEVHFDLKNESRSRITITSHSTSCGCMVLTGKDGRLKTPFDLEEGATFPIALSVATNARVGPQKFNLSVVGEGSRGTMVKANATVRVNVLATLQAEPSIVMFRRAKAGSQLSAEVKLADVLPDPGVTIREVKVSNEKCMRVQIQPESGPSKMFGDSVAGRARGTLKLFYLPEATEGRLQEIISIVPEGEQFPLLQVPVYCEFAEPPFKFVPRALTIPANAGESFRRKVSFETEQAAATLTVLRSPPGIKVEVDELPSGKTITIAGEVSSLAQGAVEVVFLVNSDEIVFPIRNAPID